MINNLYNGEQTAREQNAGEQTPGPVILCNRVYHFIKYFLGIENTSSHTFSIRSEFST